MKQKFDNYGHKPRSVPPIKSKAIGRLNVNIETWADIDKQTYFCWGDYWVKYRLQLAFESLGCNVGVHPDQSDFTVYLFGSPFKPRVAWPYFLNERPSNVNICWFYSHPDKMTIEEMKKYDIIFCLSEKYLNRICGWHPAVQSEALLSCTDFRAPLEEEKLKDDIDILFVGNARGGLEYGRKAIYWLEPPEGTSVHVYGHKWHNPKYDWMAQWYKGQYFEYQKLNVLYNRAKITLVDGHEDMAKYGFVPMKIFDILASGGFVISASNIGIRDIFGDNVPQFDSAQEMNDLIEYYLRQDDVRKEKAERGKEIALAHTYKVRAETILKTYKSYVS